MRTLNLQEAAAFLHVHPKTLAERAAAGLVPGAKEGRAWVFIDVDLAEHLRAKYARRVSEGEHGNSSLCHSTDAKAHPFGGLLSLTKDAEYRKVLALPSGRKPRNTRTN